MNEIFKTCVECRAIVSELRTSYIFASAILGHEYCLDYWLAKGCRLNACLPMYAAQHNQLNYLKYLHHKGCPWNALSTAAAAQYNQLDCLQFLVEHGCPVDGWAKRNARDYGSKECIEYLENMFPQLLSRCNDDNDSGENAPTERG